MLGPTVAQAFADLHRSHGVDLRLGTQVTADDLAGADLVVAGIGVSPRVALAEAAGLDVDNGVLVDAGLRTSVPSVLAVGDIANHAHPVLGRRIRVEHWDTAINQAKVAAHNLAGGDEVYDAMPYFFTDQYDLGMEYVGNAGADDEVVVHGDLDGCSSARSGCVTAGSSRRCTPTTGTRPTTCARRWPPETFPRLPDPDPLRSGVEGVELGLGHGVRVGVEAHVREQRLHHAQRARGPLAPVREVARTATTTGPRPGGRPPGGSARG